MDLKPKLFSYHTGVYDVEYPAPELSPAASTSYQVSNFSITESGTRIFAGLDTCANVHSNPKLNQLVNVTKGQHSISTSGGAASACMQGDWNFELEQRTKQFTKFLVNDVICLPKSSQPLLSTFLLAEKGLHLDSLNKCLVMGELNFPIEYRNGILGIWIYLPKNQKRKYSQSEIEDVTKDFMYTTSLTSQEYIDLDTNNFHGAPGFERETYNFMLTSSLSHSERFYNDDFDNWQILPKFFKPFDISHGPFTHNVCATFENRITKNYLTGDFRKHTIAGHAFVIHPPFGRRNQGLIFELFTKLDEDFAKAPNDTKLLIIVEHNQNAPWYPLTCRYELLDVIPKGTVFASIPYREHFKPENTEVIETYFSQKRVLMKEGINRPIAIWYRDIMTPCSNLNAIKIHMRLNHFSQMYSLDLYRKGVDLGLPITERDLTVNSKYICKCCWCRARYTKLPSTHQDFSAYGIFQYLAADTTGPLPVASIDGNRYIWAIMCLRTRWTTLYFSKSKDQVTCFLIFKQHIEKMKKMRVKILNISATDRLITDLGGEYVNKSLQNLCITENIQHATVAAKSHLVAWIERYFATLWRSMNPTMFASNMPDNFWEHVALHCCFIRNRLGYRTLDNMESPYYLVNNHYPRDLKHVRIPWSSCWPVDDAFRTKLDKTDEYKWIRLTSESDGEDCKGTLVYNPRTKQFMTSGRLHVVENINEYGKIINGYNISSFDLQDCQTYRNIARRPVISTEPLIKSLVSIRNHRAWFDEDDEILRAMVEIVTETSAKPFWTHLATLISSNSKYFKICVQYCDEFDFGVDFPLFEHVHIERNKLLIPGLVVGFHKNNNSRFLVAKEDMEVDFYKSKQIKEFKHKTILFTSLLSNVNINTEYLNYIEPKNRHDMLKRHDAAKWLEAENVEKRRSVEFKYFKGYSVEKPKGVFIHDLMFIYQLSLNADGTLNKYKVRTIMRGFTFVPGRDYFETFAPVTQIASIKLFHVMVLHYGLDKYHIDVKAAFLVAKMDTDIWAKLPEGFTFEGGDLARDNPRYVLLNKAIPGVKQGAYLWYTFFVEKLIEYGWERMKVEPCLFRYNRNNTYALMLIHVDNGMVGTSDKLWLDNFMKEIKEHFILEYVASDSLLGIRVERVDRFTYKFDQEFYIESLLDEYKITSDDPVVYVPLKPGPETRFPKEQMSTTVDKSIPYLRLTMQLYWVGRSTMPIILHACQFFARYANCFSKELWLELKDLLRFVKRARHLHLVFHLKPGTLLHIRFACDADYAGRNDKKSTVGVFGHIETCLILAEVTTISSIVTSSCESESHGIVRAAKGGKWMLNWVLEVTPKVQIPMWIFNDNQSAITILSTRSNSGRSKHFDVGLRYVNELVERKLIVVSHIKRNENFADILTHPLSRQPFEQHLLLIYGDCALELLEGKLKRGVALNSVSSYIVAYTEVTGPLCL